MCYDCGSHKKHSLKRPCANCSLCPVGTYMSTDENYCLQCPAGNKKKQLLHRWYSKKTSNKESLKALYFRTCLYTNRAGKRFVNTTFSVLVHPNGVQSNPLFKIITIKKIDQKGLKKKIINSYPFLITLSKKATLVWEKWVHVILFVSITYVLVYCWFSICLARLLPVVALDV